MRVELHKAMLYRTAAGGNCTYVYNVTHVCRPPMYVHAMTHW